MVIPHTEYSGLLACCFQVVTGLRRVHGSLTSVHKEAAKLYALIGLDTLMTQPS